MAAILWPAYWDPTVSKKSRIFKYDFFFVQAEWMCADICANPEDTTMTCDDCKMGIQVYMAHTWQKCNEFKQASSKLFSDF